MLNALCSHHLMMRLFSLLSFISLTLLHTCQQFSENLIQLSGFQPSFLTVYICLCSGMSVLLQKLFDVRHFQPHFARQKGLKVTKFIKIVTYRKPVNTLGKILRHQFNPCQALEYLGMPREEVIYAAVTRCVAVSCTSQIKVSSLYWVWLVQT